MGGLWKIGGGNLVVGTCVVLRRTLESVEEEPNACVRESYVCKDLEVFNSGRGKKC